VLLHPGRGTRKEGIRVRQPSRPPRRGAPAEPPASGRWDEAVELDVVLRDTEPPVWRPLLVPPSLPLRQLPAVLQTAMAWQGAHLYLFEVAGVRSVTSTTLETRWETKRPSSWATL
jgi:hypothetical protein